MIRKPGSRDVSVKCHDLWCQKLFEERRESLRLEKRRNRDRDTEFPNWKRQRREFTT